MNSISARGFCGSRNALIMGLTLNLGSPNSSVRELKIKRLSVVEDTKTLSTQQELNSQLSDPGF